VLHVFAEFPRKSLEMLPLRLLSLKQMLMALCTVGSGNHTAILILLCVMNEITELISFNSVTCIYHI
jgi:hypothetical protein